MSADITAIRRRVAEWEKATGPGGEKAWLAGLLAADARTLLVVIDQLHNDHAATQGALRSLAQAYTVATGLPSPVEVPA
ncbi:hypothetical protein [Micromonospora sp. NPDC049891]|uniref:hypothetical protein n=1 Tax=Micromonospora sp. NPDC049891 TaxID=3155655 RepID=UPI0033D01DA4